MIPEFKNENNYRPKDPNDWRRCAVCKHVVQRSVKNGEVYRCKMIEPPHDSFYIQRIQVNPDKICDLYKY
jgi:hypothetical protein